MTYPIELDIDRIKRDYKWSDYPQQAKDDIETLIDQLEHYEIMYDETTIDELRNTITEYEVVIDNKDKRIDELSEKIETQIESIKELLEYNEKNNINIPIRIVKIAANYGFNWE